MPYSDKKKQREFQRKWMAKRRKDYFKNKLCQHSDGCISRATTLFQCVSYFPNSGYHRLWSMKDYLKRLDSFVVVCDKHHKQLWLEWHGDRLTGKPGVPKKLNIDQVRSIKRMLVMPEYSHCSLRKIGRIYNVSHYTIMAIRDNKIWKHA
jgi:hypothetical protein